MKILRLELFGFKSFKDRTVISFDQPITAIVGSNGCGKSNVVDALYWVMGDMSPKHLRGSSMVDVIFSGSRDAAAMDMAEVTLVLQRDPATDPELPPQYQSSTEIQITRRYYRSGESEYLMNKVLCRLRDIQEFFMDTGVGAKAYSIIEQGAITRMVAQKPEERRTVIEEVAGIMKFKARKAETERKLESAQVNLSRIDDILKDLQKQLSNLKRQVEKASRFKTLSEELKELELSLASREWSDRSTVRAAALLESTEVKALMSESESTLEAERLRLEEQRQALNEAELQLKVHNEKVRAAELALKDLETRMAGLIARKDGSLRRQESLAVSLGEVQERREQIAQEQSDIESALAEEIPALELLKAQLNDAERCLSEAREKTHTQREQAQELRNQVHADQLARAKSLHDLESYERTISKNEERVAALEQQLQNLDQDLEQKNREHSEALGYLEHVFTTRKDLESAKTLIDEELAGLDKIRAELEQRRNEVKSELVKVKVRKEQLEILERDLEGFDSSARVLARHQQAKLGTSTLLADRVKAPALLEKAVESVLGKNLQRLAIAGLTELEELREVLKGDEAACSTRSMFWYPELCRQFDAKLLATDPENIYLGQKNEEQPGPDGLVSSKTTLLSLRSYLVNHNEVIGQLDTLLHEEADQNSSDETWFPLLRNYWVVRDRSSVEQLMTELGGLPVNFVTLEGDLFSQDGLIDLAPVKAESDAAVTGVIHRKREIQELSQREAVLNQDLASVQEKLQGCLDQISDAKESFRELTAKLATLNPDVDRHTTLLRQVETQQARLLEKKEIQQADLTRLSAELEHSRAEVTNLREIVAAKQESAELLSAKASELESLLVEAQRTEQESEEAYDQAQMTLQENEKSLIEKKNRLSSFEQELALLSHRQLKYEQELENSRSEIEEIALEVNEVVEKRNALEEEFKELQSTQESRAEAVGEARSQTQFIEKNVDRLTTESRRLTQRLSEAETALAVNDVELRNIAERIKNQYQIALELLDENALKELAVTRDVEFAADPMAGKRHAESLRQKIDNLGKINMVAVEEFQELSTRHEYLFIQRQDVFDGMQQLRDAMERIDRESRDRFAEAFNAVNEAFKNTFPVLFGGGNAELRLTQPDNMLETGVEIVAQPPGKRLQSVTLLSGGEKALTAVSLIFGIFSIKPSPFAVLDEVDAPLDDANVGRFNKQVRNMSERSQLILITHHKKTMESCDALFGVTMERPGISKVASAKLGEYKEPAKA